MKLLSLYLLVLLVKNGEQFHLGGQLAKDAQFPFYALIIIPDAGESPKNLWLSYETMRYQTCGGSLIHPEWILTAAHCFRNASLENIAVGYPPELVIMGVKQFTQVEAVLNTFKTVIFHPDYRSEGGEIIKNDIALLKLIEPYVLDNFIQVVHLPWHDDVKYLPRCSVGAMVGFGSSGIFSNNILFNILSLTEHFRFAGVNRTHMNFYSETTITEDYHAGGAFLCYSSSVRKTATQYGLMSRVVKIFGSFRVFIYEDIETHEEFIKKHVPFEVEAVTGIPKVKDWLKFQVSQITEVEDLPILQGVPTDMLKFPVVPKPQDVLKMEEDQNNVQKPQEAQRPDLKPRGFAIILDLLTLIFIAFMMLVVKDILYAVCERILRKCCYCLF